MRLLGTGSVVPVQPVGLNDSLHLGVTRSRICGVCWLSRHHVTQFFVGVCPLSDLRRALFDSLLSGLICA